MLHLASDRFHAADRVRFPGVTNRGGLAHLSVMSFHEFHVGRQANRETRGWSSDDPWATQGLTYDEPANQAYATEHFRLLK